MRQFPRFLVLPILMLVTVVATAQADPTPTKLLRFPDVHGDRVVFTYAGDLWLATIEGGTARRLTAHPGLELFAKFSPDGRQIAFTGQYDGDEQVYVMPADGGVPRQLTFYPARGPLPDRWGYDNQIYGWSPDGKQVLFRSLRYGWGIGDNRLFTVDVEGGLPEPLPMPAAGAGDFSPDGKQIAYSPLFRDFRTWKRYQGGWAQDLYVFNLGDKLQRQVTDHVRTDRDPMWIGERLYFTSDRDDKLNLYAFDLNSEATDQITHFKEFDVRWPSKANDARIVFEYGGTLHLLDLKSYKSRELGIVVPTDGLAMRPRRISVDDFISDFGLSPQGNRAVFTARGDVFSAPIEKGPTRNLTHSSDAHDKWAAWSPDGKSIAYLSDASGEEELYVVDALGREPPQQLTFGGTAMRYAPAWSPDGQRLAFSDKSGKLAVVRLDNQQRTEVADDPAGQVRDYAWSPQSGFLAFSLEGENGYRSLYIWSVADAELHRVTGDEFNEFEPAWDPDGNYLYYFSDRQFAPQLGTIEWNFLVDRETGIFALALRKDVPHPFPVESDEAVVEEDKDADDDHADDADGEAEASPAGEENPGDSSADQPADEAADEAAAKDKPTDAAAAGDGFIKIDFDGLADRVARVPIDEDNYAGLTAVDGHLLYVRRGPSYYGRSSDVNPELVIFSIDDREETTLASGIGGYALSANGKKVLVRQGGGFKLQDASPSGKSGGKTVSTGGLVADVDPRAEWRQIFDEVWRRYRDFFYVENMHGHDWRGLRERFRPLLEHVAHRSDLNYVINEMIAELNVGHAYNSGGDFEVPDRASVALPGARFELDRDSGRYRISQILQGQNEEPRYRAPLTEIGIELGEGDYVLAIDGEPLKAGDNPYELLRNKADRLVSLTVNDKPETDGAREVAFRPTSSEHALVYLNWVLDNRRRVAEATDGRVGYLHLPDMGEDGIREFIKWFYPQIRKQGLVIDVRSNGGGNVSQMVIERLRRELLATGFSRNNDFARTYPYTVFHGHLVCLLNENSASDGDIFPAMFREAGLGPLIGKRSWGGVIGITNRGTLIDGGSVFVPEFGFASKEGEWILEGYGVDPDIVVENDPADVIEGRDPQLERGIREVLKRMKRQPRELPERPAPPVKTPRGERRR